ncbi:MAG: membrane protein DedA with SNARE-associated domain/pimeloyl-ACP methyl ester carboxylesterase [Planctomycetota bacterium]|jgi:membrane protein DedA with SNARE-associated domain/pimeloyl-ACP methyl ester carboxylesterase
MTHTSQRKRVAWALVLGYLGLLLISHGVWLTNDSPIGFPAETLVLDLPAFDSDGPTDGVVRTPYADQGPRAAPAVLLLHGSPGSGSNFEDLLPQMPVDLRVLTLDLPGFAAGRGSAGDVSIKAHAQAALAFLDERGVLSAHLMGHSMGGGVALEIYARNPERVKSITMLASIGVQELELFGSYELNHAIHALQLSALHAARWLVPHFGRFDHQPMNLGYAHNFYDTDQRPLRGVLESLEVPLWIVHGERDFLVPVAAAREHHRIVPHSEFTSLPERSHFLPWLWTEPLAQGLTEFVTRVESGQALTRSQASPARLAAAAIPWDPAQAPPYSGSMLLVILFLLAASTLVSEDLACIGAGLLVSQGRLGFLHASAACFVGILVGDLGLFLLGRFLGRPAIKRRPLCWMIDEARLERASAWFRRQGATVIFLSRFTPGLRLPTYFAAGAARTRLRTFAFYFALAGLLWTPALVGLAAWAGLELDTAAELFSGSLWKAGLAMVLALILLQRLLVPALTWSGRRNLLGTWRRWTRWEFWPPWLFYPPVVLYVLWLGLRHRSIALFTASNPGIPTGGFVGESKHQILAGLGDVPEVARWLHVLTANSHAERDQQAQSFIDGQQLHAPWVLKPDVGQRGSGVQVLHSREELSAALGQLQVDSILQEFAPGPEFGLFYARRPSENVGRIISTTEKRLPKLTGDGVHTLEELILADPRAVVVSRMYFELHAKRLGDVLEVGEELQMVELGTHCRGAVFLDGAAQLTPALEAAMDRISKGFEGFAFGRYDVRVQDMDAFPEGRGFKILELNGVTSEATHIYAPGTPLLTAWRTLCDQWRLAYEIGAEQRERGAKVWGALELWHAWRDYLKLQRGHAKSPSHHLP